MPQLQFFLKIVGVLIKSCNRENYPKIFCVGATTIRHPRVVAIESNNTLTNYLAFKEQNTEPITLKIIIKIGMLIIVEVLPNLAI